MDALTSIHFKRINWPDQPLAVSPGRDWPRVRGGAPLGPRETPGLRCGQVGWAAAGGARVLQPRSQEAHAPHGANTSEFTEMHLLAQHRICFVCGFTRAWTSNSVKLVNGVVRISSIIMSLSLVVPLITKRAVFKPPTRFADFLISPFNSASVR